MSILPNSWEHARQDHPAWISSDESNSNTTSNARSNASSSDASSSDALVVVMLEVVMLVVVMLVVVMIVVVIVVVLMLRCNYAGHVMIRSVWAKFCAELRRCQSH